MLSLGAVAKVVPGVGTVGTLIVVGDGTGPSRFFGGAHCDGGGGNDEAGLALALRLSAFLPLPCSSEVRAAFFFSGSLSAMSALSLDGSRGFGNFDAGGLDVRGIRLCGITIAAGFSSLDFFSGALDVRDTCVRGTAAFVACLTFGFLSVVLRASEAVVFVLVTV